MAGYKNRSDIRAPREYRAGGAYPNSIWEIVAFGLNADVDAASAPEDVAATQASGLFPGFATTDYTAAETLDIDSGSASDDGDPGAGSVLVRGLGVDGRYLEEEVTLTGTTAVETDSAFYRVWDMEVTGGLATNVGAITAVGSDTFSANTFNSILAAAGKSQNAAFTVPLGRDAAITRVWLQASNVQSGGTAVEVTASVLRRAYGSGAWVRVLEIPVSNLHPIHSIDFASGVKLDALDDVRLHVRTASADSIFVAGAIEATIF